MRMKHMFVSISVAAALCVGFLAPAASAESLWVEQTGAAFGNIPGVTTVSQPAKKKSKPKKGLRVEKTGVTVSSLGPEDFPMPPGAPIRQIGLRSLTIYSG